jgi:hypothetical protein
MLTALIVAVIINILMLFFVIVSLQDIRERVVAVGAAMMIISQILKQHEEKEKNAGTL